MPKSSINGLKPIVTRDLSFAHHICNKSIVRAVTYASGMPGMGPGSDCPVWGQRQERLDTWQCVPSLARSGQDSQRSTIAHA